MKSKTKKRPQNPKLTTTRQKLNATKRKLDEMHAYKAILIEEGITPDRDDKELESKLIVKSLRLERELATLENRPAPRSRKYKYFSKTQQS